MTARKTAVTTIAAATLLAVAGCSAASQATTTRTVSLGAGDELGQKIRTTHIVLTGRDAFDREQVLQAESVRIANALERDAHQSNRPIRFVNEPIIIDMP